MPGKRKDFSYQSTTSQPRKQRFTANDIQWACDHKESLTIRAEKFGFSDKQQAVVRYHNIIKSPLLATDKARLDQELNMYKQIEDFKRFWLGRTRNKANLDAHDARDTFSQNVVDQKACLLKMQPRIASMMLQQAKRFFKPATPIPHAKTTTADTTPTDNDQDIFVSAPDTIPDDVGGNAAITLQP
ncbi:hypothetical protein MBANPS3_008917 [Mucor bainieri]